MKTGLNKREKFLLFFTAVLLIVLGSVRFGILPMYDRYTSKVDELDNLRYQKLLLEQKLQLETATRQNYETAEAAYEEITAKYPAVVPSEEIDKILTGLCLENNLLPVSLDIHDPVPFVNPDSDSDRQKQQEKNPAFVLINADMRVRGDYGSLKRLIDTVNETSNIRISRLTFHFEQSAVNTSAPNLTVTFEVTLLNV